MPLLLVAILVDSSGCSGHELDCSPFAARLLLFTAVLWGTTAGPLCRLFPGPKGNSVLSSRFTLRVAPGLNPRNWGSSSVFSFEKSLSQPYGQLEFVAWGHHGPVPWVGLRCLFTQASPPTCRMRLLFCLCPPGATGLTLYWAWLAVFLFCFSLCFSALLPCPIFPASCILFLFGVESIFPVLTFLQYLHGQLLACYIATNFQLIFLLVPNSFMVGKLNLCVWSGGRATLWALCLMWPISLSAPYALGDGLGAVLEGYKVVCTHECACVGI